MGLSYQESWPLITSTTSIYSIKKHRVCDILLHIYNMPTKRTRINNLTYLLENPFSFNTFSPHYPLSHTAAHSGLIHQMNCISSHNISVTDSGFALQITVYQPSNNQLTHNRYCPSTHCRLVLVMHYFHNFICEETLGQTHHPFKLLLATFLYLG